MILTREIAHASGTDAGNRSMQAAGRKRWSREDYNAAATESNRLHDILDKQEGTDHEQPETVFRGVQSRGRGAH